MSTFNKLDYFKDLYYKELDRKNTLNNDLSLPVGIISILTTVFFYFITNFDYHTNLFVSILFIALTALGIIFIVCSAFWLNKAYDTNPKSSPYAYIGSPDEMANYHTEYEQYFKECNPKSYDNELLADREFEKYLLSAYIRTTAKNTIKNDLRSGRLHRGKNFLLYCFITLLVAFIPFVINNFTKESTVQKVNIVEEVRITTTSHICHSSINWFKMSNEKQTPKQPPTPPADRHVKGNEPPKPQPKPANPPSPKTK